MRLSVFPMNVLSTQLTIDLQKLYADYLPPAILTEQAISEQLQQNSSRLYIAMFNARHIGAVKVTIDGTKAALSQLTIRGLTRRRGVGKYLLSEIEKVLQSENIALVQYDLQEVSAAELASTKAFLINSHYNIIDNIATKVI